MSETRNELTKEVADEWCRQWDAKLEALVQEFVDNNKSIGSYVVTHDARPDGANALYKEGWGVVIALGGHVKKLRQRRF